MTEGRPKAACPFLLSARPYVLQNMSKAEKIEQLIEELSLPIADRLGLEIVQVRFLTQRGRATLRIIVDKERSDGKPGSGVNVDDCADLSRALSAILDEDDTIVEGEYHLEVSSPGLERPLVKLTDFERFSGDEARIKTSAPVEGQRNFKGILRGVSGDSIDLEEDGLRKAIPFKLIVKANLIPRL